MERNIIECFSFILLYIPCSRLFRTSYPKSVTFDEGLSLGQLHSFLIFIKKLMIKIYSIVHNRGIHVVVHSYNMLTLIGEFTGNNAAFIDVRTYRVIDILCC